TSSPIILTITCSTNSYSIGGTVSGLSGSGFEIKNNTSGETKSITGNGTYTFTNTVLSGNSYSISVNKTPTNPTQTCSIANSSGTATSANITNINITCSTNSYLVGGNVSGLSGSGLFLQNNLGDDLEIKNNGSFTFVTPVASGGNYSVTVKSQPNTPTQVCSVSNGTGTITSSNITNVSITCSTSSFFINVNVAGHSGTELILQNNGGDNLTITGNGNYTFSTKVASGSNYSLSVLTYPTTPSQDCTFSTATGTVTSADITISVTCTTNTYTIGGTVSGLNGTGLVLQNNGGNNKSITANGTYSFTTSIASGSGYNVTILSNPTDVVQDCNVSNGIGAVNSANITNVNISCVTRSYTIGGTVSGLAGSGLVLQNNSGDDKAISADGNFTFATSISDGSTYAVTVKTQPSGTTKACAINNSSGTLSGSNVTNVIVNCISPAEVNSGNLQMWYKIDSLTGYTDASSVNSWTDSSGYGRDALQANASKKPTYTANSLNGYAVLSFDGSDDFLNYSGSAIDMTNNTIFLVIKTYQQSNNNFGILSFYNSGGDWDYPDGFAITYKNGNSPTVPKYERQVGSNAFLVESSASANNFHLLTMDFGSGIGNIYVNGGTKYSDSYSDVSPASPGKLTIGARVSGTYNSKTDFAEIIIYNTKFGDIQRKQIECYLKWKYNLTGVNNTTCN
ncbi:MAG: hypothetical protein KDK36_05515, partial [Leptospiraceae bacterium]|nr:hypothetical protein [Leptospiraceae bacterium]